MVIGDEGYQLQSNKANYNPLDGGSDSQHCAFHQSTQHLVVVGTKACEEGGRAHCSTLN